LDCYTLSTFFQKRFQDDSGLLRVMTAILCLFFLTWYLSAGLIAMGKLFESLFGIDYTVGVVIALSAGMAYTLFGGYVTVAWVDLFQGTFLFLMILIVPIVALHSLGGIDPFLVALSSKNIPLGLFDEGTLWDIFSVFALSFGWGLGYFGQPHIITKFMGIRDPKELNKSKYLGISWQIIVLTAAASIGFIGVVFFPSGIPNSELIFVDMVKQLFHPFMTGLILCAVLAANISTMDSQMLVAASVVTEDLYRHLFQRKPASAKLLRTTRFSVVAIALVAFALAMSRSATVSSAVYYAWIGLGCSFAPLIVMALYDSKANKTGAMAGLIVGGLMGIVWPVVNPWMIDMEIPALVPGFFLGIATIYGVSRLGNVPLATKV
jgi:sodium/proline symporter